MIGAYKQSKFNAEKQFICLCKRWFPDTYYDMFFEITFEYKELLFEEDQDDLEELQVDIENMKRASLGFGARGSSPRRDR